MTNILVTALALIALGTLTAAAITGAQARITAQAMAIIEPIG